MTAIAALISPVGAAGPEPAVRRMLAAMSARGGNAPDIASVASSSATLTVGASRHDWEAGVGPHGGGLARSAQVTVVADATLYYVDDLVRACAAKGITPARRDAPGLVIAAYAAFGDECANHLEGDFAFILWDAARGRLFASRDFAGKRTLFYGVADGALVIASTAGGVLAAPGVRREVHLGVVASVATGSWTHTDETAWSGVRELRAGSSLVQEPPRPPVTSLSWHAPTGIMRTRQPLDEGATQLRELLVRATAERLAPSGPTSVSLSGGWDSTAVFASGNEALRAAGDTKRSIAPVSISYPADDPGHEDGLIAAVAAHWGTESRFLPVDGIQLFDDAVAAATRREQPMAHTYERWNRALYRGARDAGARVMFDGLGGDQLFQVSDIYLSDLFRRGRWLELARQYRQKASGQADLKSLYRWAIRPAMPRAMQRAIARMRRTAAPRHYLDRQPPAWFRRDFLERHDVAGREDRNRPELPTGDAVLAEGLAFLRFAFFPRIIGMLYGFAVDEGVELRSPLLDERVVRFALQRPWSERADGRETKVLLRRAMRGLLPDHVLAPRPHRTGVTSAYFLRQMRGAARPLVEGTFFLTDSRLASLGMIDPQRLRRAWEFVLGHDDDELAGRIFFTLQAELWLRAQEPA
jgi:asparagine synthase (glutamine-hydrolysing)